MAKKENLDHLHLGVFLKDAVYGANDGIISTFAVVAGVTGAALSPLVVVVIGLASLFADGFSMAVSNFLASRSALDFTKRERRVEAREVEVRPESERGEVRDILIKKGYEGQDLEQLVVPITKNKRFWLDFMMHEELGLATHGSVRPLRGAITTFVAFIVAGFLPIAPYIFGVGNIFLWSVLATALVLFVIGSLRTLFTEKNWFLAGLEMLFLGGVAAIIAYSIGFLISSIV